MPHTEADEYSMAIMREGSCREEDSNAPGGLKVGSRLGGRGLWIYLNANALGRRQGEQNSGGKGQKLLAWKPHWKYVLQSLAPVPSDSLGSQPWGLTRALPEALPVKCHWAEGLHCRR